MGKFTITSLKISRGSFVHFICILELLNLHNLLLLITLKQNKEKIDQKYIYSIEYITKYCKNVYICIKNMWFCFQNEKKKSDNLPSQKTYTILIQYNNNTKASNNVFYGINICILSANKCLFFHSEAVHICWK